MTQTTHDKAAPDLYEVSTTPSSTPKLVTGLREDIASLMKMFRLLLLMGALGAVLVVSNIATTALAYRSANNNGELLRLARPVINAEGRAAAARRQACLVLLAADKPTTGCEDIKAELARIQAGGR